MTVDDFLWLLVDNPNTNPFTLFYGTGVIIDRLVKPLRTVVDYNTEFSGITEATLANVTTSLSDVR